MAARSIEQLTLECAQTALRIQTGLQKDRSLNMAKHFVVSREEFIRLLVEQQANGITRTANVGWHQFNGVPLWVDTK